MVGIAKCNQKDEGSRGFIWFSQRSWDLGRLEPPKPHQIFLLWNRQRKQGVVFGDGDDGHDSDKNVGETQ